jgi:acetylornithine/succinyldiaminopimelate/putrescine aminotransferase
MASGRQLFLDHLAQTSPTPLMLEIESAKGMFLYAPGGKKYFDLIAGVSVSILGHNHPEVLKAVTDQCNKHMHLMVYGEFIQSAQIQYSQLLVEYLSNSLQKVFFVNSGAEAIEGALKLARKYTGRSEILSFRNAYHGSTLGALSIFGGDSLKSGYGPLLPEVKCLTYNSEEDIVKISKHTACVVIETIQAEAGMILPEPDFLHKVSARCKQTGTLLIIDEIQTGFGRTGADFGFTAQGIVPDILVLAKSLGGGMPLGAFISSAEIMNSLSQNPALGHITTFGGHPVSCAAGLAMLKILQRENLVQQVDEKEAIFRNCLKHNRIKEIRGKGLMLAVELESAADVRKLVHLGIKNGFVTDWFIFCDTAFRITPPLNITPGEIKYCCELIMKSLDEL